MCKNGEKWLFRLEEDFTWQSGRDFSQDLAFYDKKGKRRLEIRKDGSLTVLKNYAWDGCTPKFCFLDILFGTPDGIVDKRTGKPKTYYATLIHDVLYQFLDDDLPITRKEADDYFLRLMTDTQFTLRDLYYWAVRLLGGLAQRFGKRLRQNAGKCEPLISLTPAPSPPAP